MGKQWELLHDPCYRQGFYVQNMGGAEKTDPTVGILCPGDPGAQPRWNLAQWETRYDFRKESQRTVTVPAPGVFCCDSRDKVFSVDTNTGTLGMELRASLVYDSPRKPMEGWPHLLIEGKTANSDAPGASWMKNLSQLRLSFDQRLTMFRDHMGADANPELHAGSFYIYLYIKGENHRGQVDMTWFGLTLFDNRFDFDEEKGSQDGGKADASGLFIYQVPTRAYRTQPVKVGADWLHVDVDVLPYVWRALELAHQRGYMLGVTPENLYVDGMNMGWEMPGTYDGNMEIRSLRLTAWEK